eukprot:5932771-Pyramimonas_sp.AAC.1
MSRRAVVKTLEAVVVERETPTARTVLPAPVTSPGGEVRFGEILGETAMLLAHAGTGPGLACVGAFAKSRSVSDGHVPNGTVHREAQDVVSGGNVLT